MICKTCGGTGIEYDGGGHTCTACNGVPPAGGDVEVLAITSRWFVDQWYASSPDKGGWHVGVKGLNKNTPEGIELVDRAHVTRLQAEVEDLRLQCGGMQMTIDELQAELTKAREELNTLKDGVWHALDNSTEDAQTDDVTFYRPDFVRLCELVPEEWHEQYHNQSPGREV